MLMKNSQKRIAYCVAQVWLSACSQQIIANGKNTQAIRTICDGERLLRDKDAEVMTIDADFRSDGQEYSFLIDAKGCPGRTLGLRYDQNIIKDRLFDEFDSVPWGDPFLSPDQIHVKIYGTLMRENGTYKFYVMRFVEVEK